MVAIRILTRNEKCQLFNKKCFTPFHKFDEVFLSPFPFELRLRKGTHIFFLECDILDYGTNNIVTKVTQVCVAYASEKTKNIHRNESLKIQCF